MFRDALKSGPICPISLTALLNDGPANQVVRTEVLRPTHPHMHHSSPFRTLLIIPIVSFSAGESTRAQETPDTIASYLASGSFDGELGLVSISHEYRGASDDSGNALGFLQLQYKSIETWGLHWGAWWYGVKSAWEMHPGDYERLCKADSSLRECFVSWNLPGSQTTATAGRFSMRQTTIDGRSHQGIEIVSNDIADITIRGGAFHRWSRYNRIHVNFQGMTGWYEVDAVHEDAGDLFWFGSVRKNGRDSDYIEVFGRHQDNVMTAIGAEWNYSRPVASNRQIGVDGIFAYYVNGWPEELQPDYENAYTWLIHASMQTESLSLGIGWHGVSDHTADIGVGPYFWIDPLVADNTLPYDARNRAQLFYVDAETSYGPVDLTLAYGYGINQSIDVDSHEFNAIGKVHLREDLSFEIMVSWNMYEGDLLADYVRTGTLLTFEF